MFYMQKSIFFANCFNENGGFYENKFYILCRFFYIQDIDNITITIYDNIQLIIISMKCYINRLIEMNLNFFIIESIYDTHIKYLYKYKAFFF